MQGGCLGRIARPGPPARIEWFPRKEAFGPRATNGNIGAVTMVSKMGVSGKQEKGTTRRSMVWSLAAFVSFGLGLTMAWRRLTGDEAAGGDPQKEMVAALLDILVPGTRVPGHRATGILDAVLADFRSNMTTHRALLDGLILLDEMARRRGAAGFLSLDRDGRLKVVEKLSRSAPGTTGWLFFGYLRERAMLRHYANPISWGPLGLHHPPQPKGYRDYREPPSLES